MAETVTPSVRGRLRVQVAALLVGAGAVTAGLAGFAVGVLWLVARLPRLSGAVGAGVVVVTLLLDTLRRPAPLCIGRQVPQAWGRLFDPRTAAALYGARLGVGPLTILSSWAWWGATVLGASAGVGWSVAVGLVFALARGVVVLVASTRAAAAGPAGMAALRGREAAVTLALRAGALALAAGLLLAGCTGGRDGEAGARSPLVTTTTPITPPASDAPPVAPAPVAAAPVDDELARRLLTRPLDGFVPAHADRFRVGPLDLAAAAAVEADPAAERTLLETRRFERGWARVWVQGDERLSATVYRFASPADAEAYRQDGLILLEGQGAQEVELPTVPGARGFSLATDTPEGSRTIHGATLVHGRDFFLLFVSSPRSSRSAEDARALVERQHALLQCSDEC